MDHCYAKKDANPSKTTSFSISVFGFVTLILCESLGIVSKNFSISLNCEEFIDSKKSTSSFLVTSEVDQASSSVKILRGKWVEGKIS